MLASTLAGPYLISQCWSQCYLVDLCTCWPLCYLVPLASHSTAFPMSSKRASKRTSSEPSAHQESSGLSGGSTPRNPTGSNLRTPQSLRRTALMKVSLKFWNFQILKFGSLLMSFGEGFNKKKLLIKATICYPQIASDAATFDIVHFDISFILWYRSYFCVVFWYQFLVFCILFFRLPSI